MEAHAQFALCRRRFLIFIMYRMPADILIVTTSRTAAKQTWGKMHATFVTSIVRKRDPNIC